MTGALKAMIEAMREELLRQDRESGHLDALYVSIDSDPDPKCFDLEKVARAGLQALAGLPAPGAGAEDIFARADAFEIYGREIDVGQLVFDMVVEDILK